jgi:hypothetical protein
MSTSLKALRFAHEREVRVKSERERKALLKAPLAHRSRVI